MTTSVKCPVCQTETPWTGNPYRPFCSRRCHIVDLGAWVDGTYRVAGEDVEPESVPADETDRQ